MTFLEMAVLRANLQPGPYRTATVVSSGLSVLAALLLMGLFGADIVWILWGQVISLLVIFPYVYRRAGIPLVRGLHPLSTAGKATLRRFIRFGFPMVLWFTAANILHREDLYVIGAARGTGEVGVYSVNYGLVFALSNLVMTPVLLAAGPVLYQQWGRGLVAEAERTISHMTELYLVLGLAFLGGIAALGQPFVTLVLGRQFWPGASILVPVAIGRVLWGAAEIGHKGLELSERTLTIASAGPSRTHNRCA